MVRLLSPTKHEGRVWYKRYGDDWGRERGEVTPGDAYFFPAYDSTNANISRLLRDAGYTGRRPVGEKQLWEQIGRAWTFLSRNVRHANSGELSPDDRWPSLVEYAAFYASHDELAWWACFSKAHVFASILGRMVDRDRIVIASTHHTENGAPPTATHVYVAVYVAGEWYYLDPAAVHMCAFPEFAQRRSIGVPSMTTVDYRHPYKILVLPGSTLSHVPYLAAGPRAVRPTDLPNATRLRLVDQPGSRRVIVSREDLPKDYNAAGVVAAVMNLHAQANKNWPEHFRKESCVRTRKEFDVAGYFGVLKHISPPRGSVLDYVYRFSGGNGRPHLYLRETNAPPFKTHTEYEQALGGRKMCRLSEAMLFSRLRLDGSPESFFEQFVFEELAGQFYLAWHNNYNDTEIVTTRDDMERIIKAIDKDNFGTPLTDEQKKKARESNLTPSVCWLDEDVAEVSVVCFSKWVGLYRVTRQVERDYPHIVKGRDMQRLVRYNCGVRF
jgi:hypothetical protein